MITKHASTLTKQRIVLATAGSLMTIGLALLLWPETDRVGRRAAAPDAAPHPHVINTEGQFTTDFTDPRRVVGYTDDVFFGQVKAREGQRIGNGSDPRLRTSYSVRVLDRIKGATENTMTVTQIGGVDNDGNLVLLEEDPLLEPGRIYLLATFDNGGERLALAQAGTESVPDAEAYKRLKMQYEKAAARPIGPKEKKRY